MTTRRRLRPKTYCRECQRALPRVELGTKGRPRTTCSDACRKLQYERKRKWMRAQGQLFG